MCYCVLLCIMLLLVLEEVESQVSKLRNELRKQLLQNPSTLEDQKRLIKWVTLYNQMIVT